MLKNFLVIREGTIKAMIKKKKKGHWKVNGDYIVHFVSEAWYAIW